MSEWKDDDGYNGESPEDLICGFLDNGQLGLDLIRHLRQYGWTLIKVTVDTRTDTAKDASLVSA